jgi:osmotically-inducible protein OsmY
MMRGTGVRDIEMMRTDLALHAAVSAAVRAVLGKAAAEVTVVVRDGVVTLAGIVNTPAEKMAAEREAQRVQGVHAVAEELGIRSADLVPLTDEMLARTAVDALAAGVRPIGRDVTIKVENGWVSLGGVVASPAEYTAVERALECLPGVRGMTSEVRVTGAGERAPATTFPPLAV